MPRASPPAPPSRSKASRKLAAAAAEGLVKPRGKLTLVDVASALGVSRTTVSNAFNRPEQLSVDLRNQVLAKSRELGYFGPDPAARALRRRESREVAVVFHHNLGFAMGDPLSMQFLRGVAEELDARQMNLHILPKMGRSVSLFSAFQTTADALIVWAEIGPELVPEVKAATKPLVLVDTHVPGLPSLRIDDRHGATLAMDHALRAAPDQVLVLSFVLNERQRKLRSQPKIPRSPSVAVERTAGYLQSAMAHGLVPERLHWLEIDDISLEPDLGRIEQFLAGVPAGTRLAVVAMTDHMALAALRALRGFPQLQAAAVVGFDDIPAAAAAGLTTVRQDAQAKGRMAVRMVLSGEAPGPLPLELIVRST
jgi:DNA-binding LacI/PurR family transcriptional regulator